MYKQKQLRNISRRWGTPPSTSSSASSSSPPRPTARAGRKSWDEEQRIRREQKAKLEGKLDELQEEEGAAQRGREWTRAECVLIIQCVIMVWLDFNVTKTEACRRVAHRTRRGYATILSLVNAWVESGELLYREGAPRGQASENYRRSPTTLSEEQRAIVLEEVRRVNSEGQPATARVLQSFIQKHFGLIISRRRLCQQFRSWGGRYKKMKELTPIDKEFHERRVAQFIVKYAKALKLHSMGTHVIVYTDESYAHNNHASLRGWVFPSSEGVNISRRDGRLIILHAMTKDGLLVKTSAEGDAEREEEKDRDLNQATTNAEYIYEIEVTKTTGRETVATKMDTKDDKDIYHGNINSVLWLKWFENRLLPAFKAKYPDKKMILIMDNASYHIPMDDDWLAPRYMNRKELIEALEKYGIESFEGIRPYGSTLLQQGSDVVTFTERTWKRSRGGNKRTALPYNKELRVTLNLWLKSHPHLLKSITRKRMGEMDGLLIFTPPLVPEFQPIELLWGMIKKLLAGAYTAGRKVEEARQQLMEILYTKEHRRRPDWTGPAPARGVTASHCKGMIRISEKFMNEWISSHDRLIGHLEQLIFPINLEPERALKDQKDETYNPPENEWRTVSEDDWEDKVKEVVSLLMNHGLLANEAGRDEAELEKELARAMRSTWGGEEGEETEGEESEEGNEEEDEEGENKEEEDEREGDAMLAWRIGLSGEEVKNMAGEGMVMMMAASAVSRTLHPMFSLATDPHILSSMPR
jgi:transposase